jgi:large subunit ribosomal protein L29
MKASKIRELSPNELNDRIAELKSELFNLRFQQATGQLQNPIRLSQCKKDIARIKTIIRENEMAEEKRA